MTPPFTVTVPATTANLGPGFDCLGAALSLHNRFSFSLQSETDEAKMAIAVRGEEADRVTTDGTNLVAQVFGKLFDTLGRQPPAVKLEIELGVPLARGLGSSATAIVGGLLGANHLAGNPLSLQELMQMAIALEGHPDNVVPALLGGCQLAAADEEDWLLSEVAWHSQVIPVVAIPDFELSTAQARRVLPDRYSRQDAIFNTTRLALLVKGLEGADGDRLRVGMQDRIHQPYRQTLIPGYEQVRQAALAAGAYGLAISGAGPTLLALTAPEKAQTVVTAMQDAWGKLGTQAEVRSLGLDRLGATVASG